MTVGKGACSPLSVRLLAALVIGLGLVLGLLPGFTIPTLADSVLEATLTSGKRVTELRYSRHDDIVRIEDTRTPESGPAPPVNLLDLESGGLTIFYPHNSAFIIVPAERLTAKQASIGPRFPVPGPATQRNGETAKPELPNVPGMPDLPQLPPGIGPRRGGNDPTGVQDIPGLPRPLPGMGGAPPMPAMPGRQGEPTLEKSGETREIHGVTCTKYTLSDPREGTLEVWATGGLMPFFLLVHEPPRLRGPREFHQSWPAVLRRQGLFPMLAVLRDESGKHELLRFEVTKHDPGRETEDPGQFEVPPGFHEVEPLPF